VYQYVGFDVSTPAPKDNGLFEVTITNKYFHKNLAGHTLVVLYSGGLRAGVDAKRIWSAHPIPALAPGKSIGMRCAYPRQVAGMDEPPAMLLLVFDTPIRLGTMRMITRFNFLADPDPIDLLDAGRFEEFLDAAVATYSVDGAAYETPVPEKKKSAKNLSLLNVTEEGEGDDTSITVTGDGFKAEFRDANLVSLAYDGKEVLKAGPQPEIYRAPVDNDKWIFDKEPGKYLTATIEPSPRAVKDPQAADVNDENKEDYADLCWKRTENGDVSVTSNQWLTLARQINYRIHTTWDIARDGTITVKAAVHASASPVSVYRNGFSMILDGAYSHVSYLGYGPQENYRDRRHAAWFDRFDTTVLGMIEPYVKSQSYGNRIGTKNVILYGDDEDLPAVSFTLLKNENGGVELPGMEFSVSPWTETEIAESYTRDRLPTPGEKVVLHLDSLVSGLGGASCGPEPLPEYKVGNRGFTMEYVIAPFRSKHIPK